MSRESGQYPPLAYPPYSEARQSAVTTPTSPYPEGRPSAEMATLPPPPMQQQPHDPYRPQPGYNMYPPHPTQMPYPPHSGTNSAQPPPGYPPQQAPRQRPAIACRYCRRRKIRCHGFDASPDGKCTNCLRFHQDCIFTPVSSQAHAFVPAHTAYPHLRNSTRPIQAGPDGRPLSYSGQPGPPLYGAHGQPLGPMAIHDPNYAPQQQPGYGPSSYPGPSSYEDRPPLPPPDHRAALNIRRGSNSYDYPDPSHMAPVSPASSVGSYPQAGAFASSSGQPYYSTTPGDRRTSPTTSYFGSRAEASPRSNHAGPVLPPLPAGLHPPQALPSASESGRNTSPSSTGPRTGAMSVADMLAPNPASATRSTTDSDMLNALNRNRR